VSRLDLAVCLGLILSILIVYAQVSQFDFVNYDDGDYVYRNARVQEGLTAGNLKWAFTAIVAANWMPLTLLSHMLDVQLFGMHSGMHHMVNVLFHALAAILLFVVFRRTTGSPYASAFVAFFFALHPLHVGSVAWIAERKDVLSTFLWFLALYLYVRYTEHPTAGRYLSVTGVFCLGLMSKPMLVTFPFTLLLFDLWPLRRQQWPKLVLEKVPLLILSVAASLITYLSQQSYGAFEKGSLSIRAENATVSYVIYLGQTLWPERLAVFYPLPDSIAPWKVAAAAIFLLAVTVIAMRGWRTRPYLTTGWLWYLGTLVPVIGLVQVGAQSHADRYTYIPLIGLSVMLAWGAAEIVRHRPHLRSAVAAAAIGWCVVSIVVARMQTEYWRNSETLFRRAIDVTQNNWIAESNIGLYLVAMPGRAADAVPYFQAYLRHTPKDAAVNNELGASLLILGRYTEAVPYLEQAVRLEPKRADSHYNLGMALAHTPGHESDAIAQYEAALRIKPDNDLAHNNLGLLLLKQGRKQEALSHFAEAVRLHPDYGCERNLGETLATLPGRATEAIVHLQAAYRYNPDPAILQTIEHLRKEQP
jgi:tetratricopeptide (TPR) repeat protein